MGWRRLAGTALVAGLALLAVPGTATAVVQEGSGYTTPAQGYRGKPGTTDWVGSYQWNGKQVWCVQYSLLAPDSDEPYHEGDELLTKGGASLPAEVAADISFLLLRYSTTTSPDESSALAHLLHSWTAAPDPDRGITTDPNNDFKHIAYDEAFHFGHLPATAQAAAQRLRDDAKANRGPWAAAVVAPKNDQLIGTPDSWTVQITKTDGTNVAGVPVTLELTDATLESGATSGTVTTPTDGSPLVVKAVPTGEKPNFAIKLDSPADRPVVHVPANENMQRIVTTGGEKKLTANASTTARTRPGIVKVGKTDAETNAAIPGVALRVTGPDKTTPALKQDDSKLIGPDGKPVVLQTGADGTAVVPDLRTPQEICLVEVAAPKGYEESFDPQAPPSVCGKVEPGQTLVLALTNKPNKPIVPITIPAGSNGAGVVATAAFTSEVQPMALIGFGGLVLIGTALVGVLFRRRALARA